MSHWVNKYIGLKWSKEYNCFDHFCQVQKEVFHRDIKKIPDLPDIKHRKEAISYCKGSSDLFMDIPYNTRSEGDAVVFGTEGFTFHIGTYIESFGVCGVLHCDKFMGVMVLSMQSIRNRGTEFHFMRIL